MPTSKIGDKRSPENRSEAEEQLQRKEKMDTVQ